MNARRAGPSIKDVAALAGVSFQTVSKVLAGGGNASPQTRERIRAAATTLGYVPDEVARSLVRQRTQTIGVIVGDLSDHVVAGFLPGVEAAAGAAAFGVIIVNVRPDTGDGHRSVQTLLSRRVDGVVAAAPHLEDDTRLAEILADVPTVGIHTISGLVMPRAGSDHRGAARQMTEHLLDHGRERIAVVTGAASRRVSWSRLQGWADAHADRGLRSDDATLVVEGDWTPTGGYHAAVHLFAGRHPVDAVFAQNDLMAVGVLRAAAEAGLSVPDDVAVVGCDDMSVAACLTPSLTTLRVPFVETGGLAVRLLLGRIDGSIEPDELHLLPVDIIRRESCGCPPNAEDARDR